MLDEPSVVLPMKRKLSDRALKPLQVELVRLQEWNKHEGLWVCVIFEGRDAAGMGGIMCFAWWPYPSRPSGSARNGIPNAT